MAVEVHVEAVAVGNVAAEVDFALLVVRVAILDVDEGVGIDGIFNARTCAPAVEIEDPNGRPICTVNRNAAGRSPLTPLCVRFQLDLQLVHRELARHFTREPYERETVAVASTEDLS